MKAKSKEIVIPVLNTDYKTIVCWGDSVYISKVIAGWQDKRTDVKQQLTDRRGVTFYCKHCHPVIALPKKPETPEEIGTLSHEAVHAVKDIFDKLGEEYSDEVFAHSVGAIVRETLKKV